MSTQQSLAGNLPITKDYFCKRLTDLCLRSGLSGFPTDDTALHILLKSVILTLDPSATYAEPGINEKLKSWINDISHIKNIDHSTLRRRLVDAGYLTRNHDGSCYQVVPSAPGTGFFETSVQEIDVREVLHTAQEEIARRKREYLEKQAKK